MTKEMLCKAVEKIIITNARKGLDDISMPRSFRYESGWSTNGNNHTGELKNELQIKLTEIHVS